jgi:hypothetical protein
LRRRQQRPGACVGVGRRAPWWQVDSVRACGTTRAASAGTQAARTEAHHTQSCSGQHSFHGM